ncbi:MAG: tail fiber domain-containing protein [Devosia sp.]|nr:tail fiber domain-containing protein [Devosia sp.]
MLEPDGHNSRRIIPHDEELHHWHAGRVRRSQGGAPKAIIALATISIFVAAFSGSLYYPQSALAADLPAFLAEGRTIVASALASATRSIERSSQAFSRLPQIAPRLLLDSSAISARVMVAEAAAADTSGSFASYLSALWDQLVHGNEVTATNTEPASPYVPPSVRVASSTASLVPAVSAAAPSTTIITQPVIERVVTQSAPAPSGVSASLLASALQSLRDDLLNRIAGVSIPAAAAPSVPIQAFAASQRIDALSGTTLTNIIVKGVSGLTAGDIPALAYLATSGGTITGDVTISGALSAAALAVSSISSSGAIQAPYFTATSTTASTFPNLLATNSTTTNATTTNLAIIGVGTSMLLSTDSTGRVLATSTPAAASFIATSSTASQFPYASSTAVTVSGSASSSKLIVSNSFTLANLTGFLKATAGDVATSLVNLASDVTGTLPVANGGTGWSTFQANSLLLGNGNGAVATTTTGTNGQVLALVAGIPSWVATTTLATISGTISGLQLDGVFGSNGLLARTAAGTYASRTISGTANQVTVTNGDGVAGNPTLSLPSQLALGNASTTNLSANTLAIGGTATTSIASTGALTIQSLTGFLKATAGAVATSLVNLASDVTGILPVGNGGTGWAAIQSGAIPYGNGAGAIATSSALTFDGTKLIAGYASTTAITSSGSAYFATGGGNVGIGTVSPDDKFHIVGTAAAPTNTSGLVGGVARFDFGNSVVLDIGGYPSGSFGAWLQANTNFNAGPEPLLLQPLGGNVGIGTANPGAALEVDSDGGYSGNIKLSTLSAGSNASGLYLANRSSAASGQGGLLSYGNSDASYDLYQSRLVVGSTANSTAGTGSKGVVISLQGSSEGAQDFRIVNGNTLAGTIFTVQQSGKVGIGISPVAGYTFSTLSNGSNGVYNETDGVASNEVFEKNNTNGGYLLFNYNASGVGSITTNGSAISYNTTSDRRVKENIATTTLGLDTLLQLPVRNFDFITDPTHATTTGFIAQELYKVFPWAVTTNGDNGEVPLGASSTPWSVDYGRITPLIVKAVQDIATLSDTFKQTLIAWLGDARNGISSIITKKLQTEQLCIADDVGNTCISRAQLEALLAVNHPVAPAADPTAPSLDSGTTTPPTITIEGDNPATIHIGDTYADIGAFAKDSEGHDLSLRTLLNGALVSNIVINSSAAAIETIDYVATDTWGNTSTSTRTVIVEAAAAASPATDTSTSTSTPPATVTSETATSTPSAQ